MKEIRYSPRPVTDYVRAVGSNSVGPGSHPLLQADLAVWNIFFLSYPELESFADFSGPGEALWDHMNPVIPLALETANQWAGTLLVRQLATLLPPADFVEQLRRRPHHNLAMLRLFKEDVWFNLMEGRAGLFQEQYVLAPLRRPREPLTRQQDGTTGEISTNILPLSRLLH